MNDIEFETIARHAAGAMRDEAERIADSTTALATLLRDRPAHAETAEFGQLVDLADRTPGRPRTWLPMLVAAATIVTVGGVILIANRGGDDLTPSTEPPPNERVTIPEGTDAPPETNTDGGQIEPSTGPITAAPQDDITAVIAVPDLPGPVLGRRLAWSTTVGVGEAQVGWEGCTECEGLRPWAPIIMPDGDLYVADVVNSRWLWWDFDVPVATPFAPGEVVVAAPVVAPDGLIYAVVANDVATRAELRVLAFDPATMTSIPLEYLVADTGHDRLEIVNGVLLFGDQTVIEFPSSLGDATTDIDDQIVTVALSGLRRTFELPDGWMLDRGDVAPVGDGSVVLRATAPSGDGFVTVLIRLWLDGTVATGVVSGKNATTNSAVQLGPLGLVQLERTGDVVEVARYDLPEFIGPDPLAGWAVPDFAIPSLDEVPRLLPTPLVPGVVSSVRREYADPASERISYEQTWVRTGAGDAVDGVVQLTTKFDPSPIGNRDGEIEATGWPQAYFKPPFDDNISLSLHSATRFMSLDTSGLDRAAVTDIATSLTVDDGDGVGWASPLLADSVGWVLVNEGWSSGTASRTLIQQTPDGDTYVEMLIVKGTPGAIAIAGFSDGQIALGDIGGRPALLFDFGPDRSIVTWSPEDGVVVVMGSRGPIDPLIDVAESVTPVDQTTWQAASVVDTSDGDGCDSMFC